MYIGKGNKYMHDFSSAVQEGYENGVLEQRPTLVNLQCDIDHPTPVSYTHLDVYKRQLLAGVIGFATRRNGSDILVNDQSVGVIKTRNITKEDITNSVTAMLAEQVGTNVQIMDEIEIKGVHVSKKTNVMTTESLLAKLRDSVAYNIEAYAIAVDGNVVATLKNEQEAKEVLEYLNELYTPEGVEDAKITYKEDVQIEMCIRDRYSGIRNKICKKYAY